MMKQTAATMLTVLLLVSAVLFTQHFNSLGHADETDTHEIQPEAKVNESVWMDGTIIEINDDSFLMLTNNNVHMQVNTQEEQLLKLQIGMPVRVQYNGMIARSMPAQIFAECIIQLDEQYLCLTGCISGVDGPDILLDKDGETLILHTTGDTVLLVQPEAGLFVTVLVTNEATTVGPVQYTVVEVLPTGQSNRSTNENELGN